MSFFGNKNKGSSGGNTGVTVRPSTFAVNNIADRDSLVASNGAVCMVQDASSDPTVGEGFAVYQKFGERWIKISDENIIGYSNDNQSISETKVIVEEIQAIINDSTFIKESVSAPTDKTSLWLEKI